MNRLLNQLLVWGETIALWWGGVQLEGNKMHLLAAIVVEWASVQHRLRS